MTPGEVYRRLIGWTRRASLTQDLNDEVAAHIEFLARDLERDGLTAEQALAAARKQLGHAGVQRELSRDSWGFPGVDALVQDLRYAFRGLTRSPGFTLTVVITLGLGIGANAAMFAVIDRLMLRPLPYMKDPATVGRVYLQRTTSQRRFTGSTMPYTRFLDIKGATHSFSDYAAISEWRLAVGLKQDTRVRKVAGVSGSFFNLFDAQPALGRFFGPAEDVTPTGAQVAVLSYEYWMSSFGGADVIGQRLHIGMLDYTIIGVAPKGFVAAVSSGRQDLIVPITTIPPNINRSNRDSYFTDYRWDWMDILVRRKPGVSTAVATADLTEAYRRSRATQRVTVPTVLPDSIAKPVGIFGAVKSAAGPDAGLESRILFWVAGVAGIVLLIACANVANLMLARILRRRREIAVRLALGVSRARLVGQFMTEGLLLAAIGGVAGLFVAQWGGAAIRGLLLPEGSSFTLGTDLRTIGVAGVCVVVAAILTVAGPAFLATRSDLAGALKAGAREGGYRSSRLRSSLLVMQAALSVVLLVVAGLFVRSLNNVLAIPLGYDVTTVLDVYPDFRGEDPPDSAGKVAVRRRLLATAQAIPGVDAAARANSSLFGTSTTTLHVAGIDSVERLGRFNFQVTTPDYFRVMRMRILRGRGFDHRDGEGSSPTTVVSNGMARALWPGKDPIGQCIQVSWNPLARMPAATCTLVIGVADDAAQQSITDEQRFTYYLSVDQTDPSWVSSLLVRMTSADVDADIERVRRAMQAAMPGDGFVIVRPLQAAVDDQRRSWRLGATLFLAFGLLALVVAAVGLYGVIGYNVAQRMHELGVRIALGAQAGDILGLVVREGLVFAVVGVAIGLSLALIGARWIEPLLYKESARDPVTYATIGLIMILVAVVASAVPALRATRADPNRALRVE